MVGIEIGNQRSLLKRDDTVVAFRFVKGDVNGRMLRLGPAINAILSRHELPLAAAVALGEVMALAALLASALDDDDGLIIVQTKTDGVIPVLVADCSARGALRAYAGINHEHRDAKKLFADVNQPANFAGSGHLAITIARGQERYQGIVALDGEDSIARAAGRYFTDRENLATFLKIVVGPTFNRASSGAFEKHWRAGALLLQSSRPQMSGDSDDWVRARMLAETAEDHELLDADVTVDRMLMRLFHEDGVRASKLFPVRDECRCTRERIERVMTSFGAADLADMRDEKGNITFTCEFCTQRYVIRV